jgi:heat-inducible transcriptional repressor
VELVPISTDQVLAVIVSQGNEVQNRLLPRGRNMPDARLAKLSQRLSAMLQDCDINQARRRLMREMESDRMRIRGMLNELVQWTQAPSWSQEELFVSGQRQLLEVPELSVIDTVRSLMSAFEEKEALCGLIEEVERSGSGVRVFIGSEHALVNMEEVSVVLSKFEGPGKVMGTLGVIGPKRMHYERVLPVVDCTARWVSRVLGGVN